MIKNYISENIKHLLKKSELSQDDFGGLFEIGKGLISNYINDRALPKIEAIQKICLHYKISIDDFVNTDLSVKNKNYSENKKEPDSFNEPPEGYGFISLKYVELLENSVKDKERIIKELEEKLSGDKRKQA